MTVQSAATLITAASRLLLVTHVAPDGDAIGSLLGLSWALRGAGKDTALLTVDGYPDTFAFLPGSDEIRREASGAFDLVVYLDCADFSRGGLPADKLPRPPDLNIDHHATNPGFAAVNLVDVQAASTAELIAEHLPALGLPLPQNAAACLLCGLLSDTLGFRTANTSAKTLAIAQRLIDAGADLPRLYEYALNRRSFSAVQLWGQALSRTMLDGRLAWSTIPLAVKHAVGYNGKGDADVINVLTTIADADVFVVITELDGDTAKVSWRARPGYDVSQVARQFGGGGHVAAAGATLNAPLPEVERQVLEATRRLLSET